MKTATIICLAAFAACMVLATISAFRNRTDISNRFCLAALVLLVATVTLGILTDILA